MGHLLISYPLDQLLNANIYFDHVDILFIKNNNRHQLLHNPQVSTIFYSSQAYSHAIYFDTHTLTVQLGVCAARPRQFYTATVSYLCPNNNNIPATGKSLQNNWYSLPEKAPFSRQKKKQIFHATTKLQPKVIGRVYDFLFMESIGELLIL